MSDPAIMPRPQLILLARHGATEWSISGQHTGRTDIALTDSGIRQATAMAPLLNRLIGDEIPLVYTSPLIRAAETARLALPGWPADLTDSLQEVDYGSLEGLTHQQIEQQRPQWNLFRDGCPGGESLQQVAARCDSFIAKLERVAAGRTVVVFTHGHLSRILATRLLALSPEVGDVLHNDTASIGVIDDKRGRYVLSGWNLL